MRIAESELIINGDGSVFHLHLRPEELADNVILVGDPGRVDMIAEYFEEKEFRHASREFVSVTGKYKGVRMTALSTGIGTDNIDIVMNELDALANVDFETREIKPVHRTLNILRIGTSGAIQPEIPIGGFVFSHISVGCDGLLNWYADRDKIAMPEIEEAFKSHTGWNKHLPDPYFVRAGQKMIDKFKDCTIKGMTIAAKGFVVLESSDLADPAEDGDPNYAYESANHVFKGGLSGKKNVFIELYDGKNNKLDEFKRGEEGAGWNQVSGFKNDKNHTFSRVPDGTGEFVYADPTKGAANGAKVADIEQAPEM